MLKYKGYSGRFEFDASAGIFQGEVVGIRDAITFQAKLEAELGRVFRQSVDDYMAFCRERGEQPN